MATKKRISVANFIKQFKEAKDDDVRQKVVVDHIAKEYVSYETKMAHCRMIAERTMFDENGRFSLNTPARYMLLIVVFIQDHMGLIFDDIDNVQMFNQMDEIGLDDAICSVLDSEFNKYRSIMNMVVDDIFDRERSIPGYLDSQADAITKALQDPNTQKLLESVVENGKTVAN